MKQLIKFQGKTALIEQSQLEELLQLNEQPYSSLIFESNGKICTSRTVLKNYQTVNIYIKLLGGKGGFGAKLKTEGGKKVRPNQNMFSKDIQGRPIAYSTASKQYEEFIKKKLQEDLKVSKQLIDFNNNKSHLYKQNYTNNKLDSKYHHIMEQNQQRIINAMKIGIVKYFQKISNQSKISESNLKLNQQDQQELVAVKRQKPINGQNQQQQQQKCEIVLKTVTQNQQKIQIFQKPTQRKDKTAIKYNNAISKLKSLFKK